MRRFQRGVCWVLAAVLLSSAPLMAAEDAGKVANPFTDEHMDSRLLNTENVFDLYEGIVHYLLQCYTDEEGNANKALSKFQSFVAKQQEIIKADPGKMRAYGMPMSMDLLLKYLNEEASGLLEGDSPIADNPKAQLYLSALLPFVHLRGITYRVRPMVETSFVLHQTAITQLRALKQSLDVMAGTNGRAVFNFLTYPFSVGTRSGQVQFYKPSELQAWILQEFMPTLDTAILLAESAASRMGEGHVESINQQIFLKADNPFPNSQMEAGHRTFGRAEVHQYLAGLYATRAGLRLFCAYDQDDYAAATNEVANTLVKQFFKEKIPFGKKPRVGTPAATRFRILESYGKLWTLLSAEQCQLALSDVRAAVRYQDAAMAGFFAATPSDTRMTNLRWVHSTYKEYETKIAPQVRALVSGPTTLTDYVGGATIDVDLPGLLENPPADLKDFFPSTFVEDEKYFTLESSQDTLVYTNYDYGRPLSWKTGKAAQSWKRLFPNMPSKSEGSSYWDAPLIAYRDISRTYSGFLFTPILSVALF